MLSQRVHLTLIFAAALGFAVTYFSEALLNWFGTRSDFSPQLIRALLGYLGGTIILLLFFAYLPAAGKYYFVRKYGIEYIARSDEFYRGRYFSYGVKSDLQQKKQETNLIKNLSINRGIISAPFICHVRAL